LTPRRAVPALAGVVALAAASAALAAVPGPGSYRGTTGQDLDASVKVNAKHRVKRFKVHWWAPCDRAGFRWGSPDNPDGTVDRDSSDDPIKQTDDGAFSDSEKYAGETNNAGYKGHFRIEFSGKFGDAKHASGKFTIKVRVTKDGVTYDHCRKTAKWHVGP
jgi:hypothetical protein